MLWKCVKDFLMEDPDEPIPFVAGKVYGDQYIMTHDDGTKVFDLINEQGLPHRMEDSDLTEFFEMKAEN